MTKQIWCPCFQAWQPFTDPDGKCPAYHCDLNLYTYDGPVPQ